jgi:hypothetical protein
MARRDGASERQVHASASGCVDGPPGRCDPVDGRHASARRVRAARACYELTNDGASVVDDYDDDDPLALLKSWRGASA